MALQSELRKASLASGGKVSLRGKGGAGCCAVVQDVGAGGRDKGREVIRMA